MISMEKGVSDTDERVSEEQYSRFAIEKVLAMVDNGQDAGWAENEDDFNASSQSSFSSRKFGKPIFSAVRIPLVPVTRVETTGSQSGSRDFRSSPLPAQSEVIDSPHVQIPRRSFGPDYEAEEEHQSQTSRFSKPPTPLKAEDTPYSDSRGFDRVQRNARVSQMVEQMRMDKFYALSKSCEYVAPIPAPPIFNKADSAAQTLHSIPVYDEQKFFMARKALTPLSKVDEKPGPKPHNKQGFVGDLKSRQTDVKVNDTPDTELIVEPWFPMAWKPAVTSSEVEVSPFKPIMVFFSGILMDPELLQSVLGLFYKPTLIPATVKGFKRMQWKWHAVLLSSHEDSIVQGFAYQINTRKQYKQLDRYEGRHWRPVECEIIMEGNNPISGICFKWGLQDESELTPGPVLQDWEAEKSRLTYIARGRDPEEAKRTARRERLREVEKERE